MFKLIFTFNILSDMYRTCLLYVNAFGLCNSSKLYSYYYSYTVRLSVHANLYKIIMLYIMCEI